MFQIVKLQQEREAIMEKVEAYKKKVKAIFDKKLKKDTFLVGDVVLRLDAQNDEKSKHRKFDNLWMGPFTIINILGNNTFVLQNMDGDEVGGQKKGGFLNTFTHTKLMRHSYSLYIELQFLYIRLHPNKAVWFQFK